MLKKPVTITNKPTQGGAKSSKTTPLPTSKPVFMPTSKPTTMKPASKTDKRQRHT